MAKLYHLSRRLSSEIFVRGFCRNLRRKPVKACAETTVFSRKTCHNGLSDAEKFRSKRGKDMKFFRKLALAALLTALLTGDVPLRARRFTGRICRAFRYGSILTGRGGYARGAGGNSVPDDGARSKGGSCTCNGERVRRMSPARHWAYDADPARWQARG